MEYNSATLSGILNSKGKINLKSIPKDEIKRTMLEDNQYYTPDFQVGVTPSIERCVEAIIEEFSKDNYKLNMEIHNIELKWNHKLQKKSFNRVLSEFSEFMNVSQQTIEDFIEAKSHVTRKLKKKQGTFFRQLVDVFINFYERKHYLDFLIDSSPCFFESSDINDRMDYFFQADNYSFQKRFRVISTKFVDLRRIFNNGRVIQNVSLKLSLSEGENINVKYIVHNDNDKLDVVIGLKDPGIELMHYDVKRFTPRKGLNQSVEYEFKQSSSTGNYIIKSKINGQEERLFSEENKMKKDKLFETLVNHPILLGGNAFIYTLDYIRANKDRIEKAASFSMK